MSSSTTAKPPEVQAPSSLSRGAVVSYALGDVANNLSFMMTSMFLMMYMTDIVGVPAAWAGALYGITKIWAGVADLLAGSTVDKANTKWGRLRPWLLWSSTPLAIVFVLLFSVPAGLSTTQAFVWILLFDAAFQLAYSFTNIPYGSLSAAMTQNSVDRSRLAGRGPSHRRSRVSLCLRLWRHSSRSPQTTSGSSSRSSWWHWRLSR